MRLLFFLDISHRTERLQINPGVIDSMTVEEIKERYPEEYTRSFKDPYSVSCLHPQTKGRRWMITTQQHRYPRAEVSKITPSGNRVDEFSTSLTTICLSDSNQ
jgi:broad specificity phosphatase PhoE